MQCRKCQSEKLESEFLKGEKLCKVCAREYFKAWRDARKKDPEHIKKEQERQRKWWEKNRERGNERQRKYRENNTNFQLSNALRARVKYALLGCVRQDKTFDLLGCTPNEWKTHLESQFRDGMTWDNYGTFWEVDHIIPVSHFDLTNREEQKKAFHYSNTQPLEATLNKQKGNRWIG
jgi:hypothetical protein